MHILTFALLICVLTCQAQSADTRIGARHAGMGYASFTLSDDAAFFNNAGALGRLENPAGFFSYEIAADLPGANRTAAALSWPTSVGTFAAGVFRFGDDIYSEQFLSAGFGNRIGATSLGMKVNYVQYRADGFETRTAVTLDVGGLTQLTPQVYVGAGIFNVTQSSIVDGETLPISLVVSLGYLPDNRLHLAAEVEKKLGTPLRIKGGVEFGISGKLFFRSGFNLNPAALFAGVGARTRRGNFDYSTSFTYTLGFSHQASASYRLKSPTEK